MQQLGEYVVSLTAAAMICGVLLSLFPDGTMRMLLRLVCGIVLTLTALSPLTNQELPDLTGIVDTVRQEAAAAAAVGEEMGRQARLEGIKETLEAYILDKAAGFGADIGCRVTLDDQGIPVSAELWGTVSQDQKRQLTQRITGDLGLSKEKLQWIG